MAGFKVVHDLLDEQLVARKGIKAGRVDEILLELREGEPPRMAAVLVGSPLRAQRIAGWWAVLARGARRLVRLPPAAVSRIDFADVRRIGTVIDVDVEAGDLAALRGERMLGRFLQHFPFAGDARDGEQEEK